MKKLRLKTLGLLMLPAFAHCLVQAQGTEYLSNLSGDSTGSYSVASDSWMAVRFRTGSNTAGYLLNSVQLAMLDGTGDPGSFAVNLRDRASPFGVAPGSTLATLQGSADPQSAGTYAFVAPPNTVVLPDTIYFIVLSAGTAFAEGAYQWSTSSTSPENAGSDWLGGRILVSTNGLPGDSHWRPMPSFTQFALNATAIPEPSSIALLSLGGVCLLTRILKRRRVG